MTRTIDRFTPRHTLLAALVAAACLAVSGVAQAQSTSQSTASDASRMNAPNTQGVASGTDAARPGSALDSVRRDSAATDTRGATTTERSAMTPDTTRSGTAMSTQTTPQSSDLNRESSQGMTSERTDGTMSRPMGSTASDDDFRMRNDRMARAPRADRN